MTLLSIENVGKTFGIKPLFSGVTFGLEEGEKIGVIGANGSGKSTLLRVITGEEAPDTGRVVISNGKRVAMLPQNPPFDPEETVLSAVFRGGNEALQRKLDLPLGLSDPDLSVLPRRGTARPAPPSNRASRSAARTEAQAGAGTGTGHGDGTRERAARDDGPSRRRRPAGGAPRKGQTGGRPGQARKKAPRASKAARGDGPRSRTSGAQGR